MEEGGCDGGRLLIMMELWLTGNLRNEGTGFDVREKGSLERHDRKEITRENLNLKRLAIVVFCFGSSA